jgi:hypothetical protein
MVANILDCITPGRRRGGAGNPAPHSPLAIQNQVIYKVRDRESGEIKQEGVLEGNVMCTWGMNNLGERMVTGGDASDLVQMLAVGTHTQAEASDNTGLYAGTNSVYLSQASMAVSDLGNMTVEFQATIDDASAYQLHEVGLMGTNLMNNSLVARKMLGTDSINKGTGDEVNLSHRVVLATA